MANQRDFRLPLHMERLFRDAGYVTGLSVERADGGEWTEHDESSVRAMIAGVDVDLELASVMDKSGGE